MNDEFMAVARASEVPPGTGRTVDIKGIWVAVFNVEGTFYAIDNTCPHAGGPLGEGKVSGAVVECPWHGWKFDVTSGQRIGNPDFEVLCCPTRVVGDEVYVALPPDLRCP